jgi:carbapenam-3-carboxylate synthase
LITNFILCPKTRHDALSAVAQRAGFRAPPMDLGRFWLATGGSSDTASSAVTRGERVVVMAGQLFNRLALRSLLAVYDSRALVARDVELVALGLEHLGDACLALFEGAYAGLVWEARTGTLRAFTDSTGQMSLYVTREPSPWVSSELKLLCLRDDFAPDFAPPDEVASSAHRADDYCPVQNVDKLKPGAAVSLSLDGAGSAVREQRVFHRFRPGADRTVSRAEALSLLDQLLVGAVRNYVEGAGRVAVPLSGGVDSSLITALAARQVPGLSTLSVGTELSNEFEFAEIVARHVGTKHRCLLLSKEDTLRGLVAAIYYNEIYDGLSAEVQAPLFALYARVSGEFDTLLTGYGADLLFGGMLPYQPPARSVNETLWGQIYRTRWTGEFGQLGAQHHHLTVKHPFWAQGLLGFCLDLDPSLKISGDQVKIILREYAARDGLLPPEIAWRKKIGIHEGSSVNRMFAESLGTTISHYDFKTRFSYFVYRKLLGQRLTPSDVDCAWLLEQFLAHENQVTPPAAAR